MRHFSVFYIHSVLRHTRYIRKQLCNRSAVRFKILDIRPSCDHDINQCRFFCCTIKYTRQPITSIKNVPMKNRKLNFIINLKSLWSAVLNIKKAKFTLINFKPFLNLFKLNLGLFKKSHKNRGWKVLDFLYRKKAETVAETAFLWYNIINEKNKPQQSLYINSNENSSRFRKNYWNFWSNLHI